MVSNAAEDFRETDQAPNIRSKQRKAAPSARKTKSVHSNISPSKDDTSSKISSKNLDDIALSDVDAGNVAGRGHDEKVEDVDAMAKSHTHDSNHTGDKQTASSAANNGSALEAHETDIQHALEELNRESDLMQSSNAEISRLKQLLLLQVSLISRQQDLLRLRDREIMQLKASNSNYKCQLNRVRRRISKRKSDGQDESPKSNKRKSPENQGVDVKAKDVTLVSSQTQTPTSVAKEETRPKAKKRRLEYDDAKNPAPHAETPGPSHMSSTPDKNTVPVPVSFIDQVQSELIHAMMVSPPDKAVDTFLTGASASLDGVPLKICDRCPHCVAFAQEIRRLLKSVENCKSQDSTGELRCDDDEREIIRMTGITSRGSRDDLNETDQTKKIPIMKTTTSYHRAAPAFDQNHWWWDLKCGNIIPDENLKSMRASGEIFVLPPRSRRFVSPVPTWKVQEIEPLEDSGELPEATDDQTYLKRHSKLELDEKRRKKWDIQRIREYRYNEKLRQKLMKQGTLNDAPVIESFAGHLHDAEFVEVDDSLPVNVFGYPLPHLDFEEFSLSPMWDGSKSSSGACRRRVKKM